MLDILPSGPILVTEQWWWPRINSNWEETWTGQVRGTQKMNVCPSIPSAVCLQSHRWGIDYHIVWVPGPLLPLKPSSLWFCLKRRLSKSGNEFISEQRKDPRQAAFLCGFKGLLCRQRVRNLNSSAPPQQDCIWYPGNGSILQARAENLPDRQTHSQYSAAAVAERWGRFFSTPPPQENGVSQSPEPQPGLTQFLCWFKINMFSFSIHFWLWNLQFQQIYIIFYCRDVLQQPKQIPLPSPLWKVNC